MPVHMVGVFQLRNLSFGDLNLLVMAVSMPALCSGGRDDFCREFLNLGFMSILGQIILCGWGLSYASQDICLAAFLVSTARSH